MRSSFQQQFLSDASSLSGSQGKVHNLAEQVSDIADRISRLQGIVGGEANAPATIIDADSLRRILVARRARAKFFSEGLFADPAWDILLDLLMTQMRGHRVTVSNVCVASNVPPSTALRWIKILEIDGLVARRADPLDARRFFIELTKKAEDALRNYFSSINLDLVL